MLIGIGPVDAALSAYEIFTLKRNPVSPFSTGFTLGACPKSDLQIGDVWLLELSEKFAQILGRKI